MLIATATTQKTVTQLRRRRLCLIMAKAFSMYIYIKPAATKKGRANESHKDDAAACGGAL
jgi:hypothetical protein